MVFEAVGVLALAVLLLEGVGALQYVVQFGWRYIQQGQEMSNSHDGGAARLGSATLLVVNELRIRAAELYDQRA